MIPIIDYKRIDRIYKDPTAGEDNIGNKICLCIFLVACLLLFKRYKDRSPIGDRRQFHT